METDLKKRLTLPNCPVCGQLEDELFKLFSDLPQALSYDEKARENFAQEYGFCPFHTWQLAAFYSERGIAKGFPSLMIALEKYLTDAVKNEPLKKQDTPLLTKSKDNCRVCRLLQSEEKNSLALLADYLKTPAGKAAYSDSDGLCLQHLASLISVVKSDDIASMLLTHAIQHLLEITSDLITYDKKNEARQRHTCTKNEKNAPRRALNFIAGLKSISFIP
ncbi:MAG TPA: DUF6062 family protein [Smithellaceae bacterium]|nr:DUF6062 family protein [Smithellaceae bacterium]HRS88657.1 DUF6062 family protein [Smithellaceae bacterium]HRV25937.1 DUF6062 family protein [Smithellaceae bacterium]